MTRGHRAPDGMTRGRAMRRAAGANRAGRERPPGGARRRASSAPTARARGRSKQRARDPQAAGAAPDSDLDAFFLRVRLEDTGEVFRVANCRGDMTVQELREDLELIVGIPFNLQRLQYLDQGVMRDDSTLRFYDVVPGGVLSLCVWHYDDWTELVLAAVEGDPSKLASLGIAEDSFYRTANSRYFEGEMWRQWISERAFVALYIASHRGHCDTVQYLLEQGASCQDSTPLGRTPLHAAVAMGRLGCMNLLLKHGAPIHEKDFKGETPISIARGLSRKQTERHMFLLHALVKLGKKDAKDLDMKEVFPRVSAGSRSKKPAG